MHTAVYRFGCFAVTWNILKSKKYFKMKSKHSLWIVKVKTEVYTEQYAYVNTNNMQSKTHLMPHRKHKTNQYNDV